MYYHKNLDIYSVNKKNNVFKWSHNILVLADVLVEKEIEPFSIIDKNGPGP